MPRKKRQPLTFVERMNKLAAARLTGNKPIECTEPANDDPIEDLDTRVRHLLNLVNRTTKPQGKMLFFVMYDIENNKVRRLVSKYLIDKGCFRIQRSIFLGETSQEVYTTIRNDLTEVQAAYENQDSIIVLPVSTDHLHMMKIIGQKIELDIITRSKNTLFF